MKKLHKKLFISVLSIVICFFTTVHVNAKTLEINGESSIRFKENSHLTSQAIQERFSKINNTYEINEAFSDSDAEFVTLYSVSSIYNNSIAAAASSGIVRSIDTTVCGVRVFFKATFSFGSASMFESWNVADDYIYLKSNISTIQNIQFNFKVTYYGIVGENGVGVIGVGSDTATIVPSVSQPAIYVTLSDYAWNFMSFGLSMYSNIRITTNACSNTAQLNM